MPNEIHEAFAPRTRNVPAEGRVVYRPGIHAMAKLHFADRYAKVDVWQDWSVNVPIASGTRQAVDFDDAVAKRTDAEPDLLNSPEGRAHFADLPSDAADAKSYPKWQRGIRDHLYRSETVTVFKCAKPKLVSTVGESEAEFRAPRRGRHARAA